MNWFGFIPLLVVAVFIAKWERDKTYFNRKYHEAYADGIQEGLRAAAAQWKEEIQHMAKEASAKLAAEYPVGIKVIERDEPFKIQGGIGMAARDLIQLPTYCIQISLAPTSSQHFMRYREWESNWEKQT